MQIVRDTAPADDPIVVWRSAKEEAGLAYHAWCDARPADKPEAYVVYVAAADREHAAAEALVGVPSSATELLGLVA